MEKVYIVYWSGTGNTEAMANAVADGVREAGKEPVLAGPNDADTEALKNVPGFIMGCPAMGAEVLEEDEMEPFVMGVEAFLSGKQIGLFGSYGWGDGEWMRSWVERTTAAGAAVVTGEGIIANDAPDDEAIEKCKALGKAFAEM